MIEKEETKKIIIGTVLLTAILALSYFRIFGYAGIWGYYVQLIGYAFASGYLTTVLVNRILDKLSPLTRYWLQQKTMKRILVLILAFEFAMVFAFGLDLTFRTAVVLVFIPVYQTLSKLRAIPLAESLDARMKYIPKDGEI